MSLAAASARLDLQTYGKALLRYPRLARASQLDDSDPCFEANEKTHETINFTSYALKPQPL